MEKGSTQRSMSSEVGQRLPLPPQHWGIAAALALAGAVNPLPIPLTGLHKFYLGQPLWGVVYLMLSWTQIPRIACALEGGWYLMQRQGAIAPAQPGPATAAPAPVAEQTQAMAAALRELETLRQEGLISEYEFEQKRRHLLNHLT